MASRGIHLSRAENLDEDRAAAQSFLLNGGCMPS